MLTALMVPKFYDRSRYMQLVQRIHQHPESTSTWHVWVARLLSMPHEQRWCWFATVLFLLALLTLPWFRAEFIPSGTVPHERYGTFYLWGLRFAHEWVPIADTWMFAAGQVWLDVVVFFFIFCWRASEDACLCVGSPKHTTKRPVHEQAWFRGIVVVYWLWRVSELVALGSFYGGIKTLLVYNILVFWLIFVGFMLGWGKGGIFRAPRQLPVMCSICGRENVHISYKSGGGLSSSETAVAAVTAAIEFSEESSGSTSSTPFNGSPRTKNRKRAFKMTGTN